MKTPEHLKTSEENKCGMECIRSNASRICVKPEEGQCPRCKQLVSESLDRIQHLESTYSQVSKALCGKENATLDELLQTVDQLKDRLAQVERERDAAVHDMENYAGYGAICKHFDEDCPHVEGCPLWPSDCESYEWRGVCPENSKEEQT